MLAVQLQTFKQTDTRAGAQREHRHGDAARQADGTRQTKHRDAGHDDDQRRHAMGGRQRRAATRQRQQPGIERRINALGGELGSRRVGDTVGRVVIGGQKVDRIVATEIGEQGAAAGPPQHPPGEQGAEAAVQE